MQIPLNFKPRKYQADFLRAMESGITLAAICWSRRAGKDYTCFGYAVKKMVETPMNVVLVFPTKEQGRKSFWNNIENDGFKTIDHIPKSLRASTKDESMFIRLKNGSTFQVLGTKDPDALRGANGKLYIFSEFVDIDSAALDVIRPIVEVNGGQIILNSTPKIDGISGGTFKILFDRAKKNPKHYASLITAHEYLSDETLEEIRQETIERNGNDFFFRQEYLCDWGQASATSYFGQILKAMEADKRIGVYPWDQNYPVYTAWDLGISDSTAITFFQYYLVDGKPQPRIIDYYEMHDIGDKAHVEFLKTKPYNYAWHFLPHDANVRDPTDAIKRAEKMRELGLTNSSVLTREVREDGIKRAVEQIGEALINKATTTTLIAKLYLYKRKYNPLTGDYEGPEHKTESHAADSIRYMYTALEQEFDHETCAMYMIQSAQEDSYDSELVETNFYQPAY